MNLSRPALSLSALLFTTVSVSAMAAAERERTPASPVDPENVVAYELSVVSVATSLKCDASHSFRQTLAVCSVKGCHSKDVTERNRTAFVAERGGRIAVATSTAYEKGGVIYGDSAVDELRTGKSDRFVQTVAGKGGCMKSVVYELRRVGE